MRFARKNIRLPVGSYKGRRNYFLTVCCHGRNPFFADARWVSHCVALLREASVAARFAVHAFCFMPDHLHLLVEGLSDESSLHGFVSRFKQLTAYAYRRKTGSLLWQPKFYDHVLRRDVEMDAVAWYIWMNPVRKGLCDNPRVFPHSGSMTTAWPHNLDATTQWVPPWKEKALPG